MSSKLVIYTLVILVLVFSLLFYKSQEIKRTYKAEALKGLERTAVADSAVLTAADISQLPEPVQKYLKYTGVIGKEKIRNYRMVAEGQMKPDPKKDWMNITTQQYSFTSPATRLYFIHGKFSGIPAIGLDSYLEGKGRMFIKLFGLLKVVDGQGPEMNQGALVTLFNDMCLIAPGTLIDENIQWEPIDTKTAKGTFESNGCKVSATLYFNDEGALVNFVTDDRFYSPTGTTYEKIRWSTPVSDYKDFHGVKIASYGEAVWHFPEGDYCYARANIKEVEYNVKTLK